MPRVGTLVVSLCLVLAFPGLARAQAVSATTGALNGKVTDASGGVLPGVTVTISSAAMQGVRSDTTDTQGTYRFAAVPPGDYKIQYELGGFKTIVREGVRIGLGFTSSVNIQMEVASLAESVTVTGESPVVDVTTTKTQTTFDAAALTSLPNARDFWSILAAAPAIQMQRIDVGGSAAGTQTGYSTYDTKSDQHRPMVEGIVNTEGTSAAGFYYDYGAMDEVAVTSGSNSAEMPWAGVMSQFVVKSGGNAYHGRLYGDYENKNIQSTNIDSAQIALGLKGGPSLPVTDLNKLHSYHDLNGDVGGYVKQDKLWWYASVRDQNAQNLLPNFPVKPFETHLNNITGKLTYALSTNNKLTAFAMGGRKIQPNRLDTFLIPATAAVHNSAASTWDQSYWGHTYKVGWDSVVNSSMFFEVHGGQFRYDWPNTRYTQSPAYADLATNVVSGGNQDGWHNILGRNQILGSFSYYKENMAGSHNFKVGGEVFDEYNNYLRGQGGLGQVPNDVLNVLRNGKAAEVLLFESPTASLNGLRTYGFFAQDTWRAGPHLTLNIGVAFDRYRSYLPGQQGPPSGGPLALIGVAQQQVSFAANDNVLTWNLPAPRLGFTYDLFGNGKTVLKGNYALYWWNPGTPYVDQLVNPNAVDWYKRYTWTDTNANGVWDPGEQGVLESSFGGAGSTQLDPNLQDTRTREVATWLEHELVTNVAVHAGFIWRRIDQLSQQDNLNRPVSAYDIPVQVQDPGPDGHTPGQVFTAYNLDPANLKLPVVNILHNTPGKDDFYNLEFAATRRKVGRWSLNASFSYRWNYDNANSYFGQNLRVRQDVQNPNDTINTDNGRYDFTTWAGKINGTFDGPWNLAITPAIREQSGQPYGRTFLATMNYGSQRFLAEPINSHRQDNITLVDVRVERLFHMGQRTLSTFIDGYNLLNTNAAPNITWSSGAAYLQPVAIIAPRIFRFGARFDW